MFASTVIVVKVKTKVPVTDDVGIAEGNVPDAE
jgi:hypothetical protein